MIFFKKNSIVANTWGGAVARTWLETLDKRDKSGFESEIILNQGLAEELHKSIVKNFEKRKLC